MASHVQRRLGNVRMERDEEVSRKPSLQLQIHIQWVISIHYCLSRYFFSRSRLNSRWDQWNGSRKKKESLPNKINQREQGLEKEIVTKNVDFGMTILPKLLLFLSGTVSLGLIFLSLLISFLSAAVFLSCILIIVSSLHRVKILQYIMNKLYKIVFNLLLLVLY